MDSLTFAWSHDPTNGEEYGLLAKIIRANEYTHLTNQMWVQEVEPASYNPAIADATVTHMQKQMEEEWEEKRKFWYNQKGFLRGIVMNMQDTLVEQYYSQLKHVNTAYRNTTQIQILDHLDT